MVAPEWRAWDALARVPTDVPKPPYNAKEMTAAHSGATRHLRQLRRQRCEACDGFGHAWRICPTYFATTHIDPHDRYTREIFRLLWQARTYKNAPQDPGELGWSMLPRTRAYRARSTPEDHLPVLGKRKRGG